MSVRLSVLSVCDVRVLWPNGWMHQDETWHAGRLSPSDIVLDGTQLALPQKEGGAPQFSAHFCCGQMAGRIKMPLGREIGLIPSDIVLDRDPAAPLPKRGRSPEFSAHVYCVHGRPSQLLLSSCTNSAVQ